MVRRVDVEIRGAPWKLLQAIKNHTGPRITREFLIDGPRGTGKTLGCGWVFRWLMETYPGIRIIFVRRTRRSITQSFCPDFENIVLANDPKMRKGASAGTRSQYDHPNGAVLALAGMDDRGKVYSTNWDVFCFEEARQFDDIDIVDAYGTLRQFTPGMPMQVLLMLTNPDAPTHHILRRVQDGLCTRFQSHLKDNPKWWDRVKCAWTPEGAAFTDGLKKLPGVLYDRNYLGLWKAAEGVVWLWEPKKHEVLERPKGDVWRAAAMDWGYTDACAFGVGEKDETGRITLCREIKRKGMGIEWWLQEVIAARRDLDIKALWVDPSRPEIIDYFNRKLGIDTAAGHVPFARPALNQRRASSPDGDLAGLDLVRHYIEQGRFVAWKDRLRHYPDPELEDARLPCSFTEEVHEYVYWRPKGKEDDRMAARDRTDPACEDHSCDMVRYLISGMDMYDLGGHKVRPEPKFSPEHVAILKAMGQWPPKEMAA